MKMKAYLLTAGLISFTASGCNGFTPGEPGTEPAQSIQVEPTPSPRTPTPHKKLEPVYISDNVSLGTKTDVQVSFAVDRNIPVDKVTFLCQLSSKTGILMKKSLAPLAIFQREPSMGYTVSLTPDSLFGFEEGPAYIEFFYDGEWIKVDFIIKP